MRSIAHISDLHFGRHDRRLVEDLLVSLGRERPDLVAFSGDVTQRARRHQFAEARCFLDRIPQPKLVVPGNHDIPLFNLYARFMAPRAGYDRYITPVSLPGDLYIDDELAVLGLDTARRFARKNGRVSVAQVTRIGRVFRDIPPDVFKAVVTHHPLGIPLGEAPLVVAGRARLALEAIANAGVHLLLSGHHHRALSGGIAETAGEGAILVLHAGTAASTRLRGGEGNTYNLIRIAGDRVAVHVMMWSEGGGFREAHTAVYTFEGHAWRSLPVPPAG